ncbi:MAG: rhomboid family intramembrane serine protease [Deltaproteobacteria bacterium]|nr:rhomboid family intramembrane serine protease [Deltaproteobacteria bacterium]
MLIIPLTGKISIRNPPAITIGIILLNCFIFFILQAGDGERYHQATQFYFNSGLAKIEISRYFDYLRTTGRYEGLPPSLAQKKNEKDVLMRSREKMIKDHVFIKKLHNDEIITPEDQRYPAWKDLRNKYEDMMSGIVSMKYGFKPAERSLGTSLTHMFVHGSFMHLLGNMIFLWLVGCVLELGCGRTFYFGIYILSGFFAVCLFALVNLDSRVPLVGASGAISGLIGAYTVLYGKKKIKVFYSIGVYFNYARVSAIILLPIWIGNEIIQLLYDVHSHVAYLAHIGGLISGAILGYLNLKFLGRVDEEIFGEDPKEKIAPLLEEALQRIGKLDMHSARSLLEQVLHIDPHNRIALSHLFNIDKLNPENNRFHKTTSKLLQHLIDDGEAYEMLHDTYREYRHISKRLRLNLDLLFRVSSIFSAHGYLEDSEKIMALLLKNRPGFQKIPSGMLSLGRAHLKKGLAAKGKRCLNIICQRYPETAESQIAKRLLKGLN